jgi:precorrin-8X/cobalt-precorrin-8 methylmutase
MTATLKQMQAADASRCPLFDAYVMVDWSAAARPRQGADSIWVHVIKRDGDGGSVERRFNPETRTAATALLADLLSDLIARDRVVLLGYDFAFGYPAGFAERLQPGAAGWRSVWRELDRRISDAADNSNNRFEVAAALNRALAAAGGSEGFPFWCCPAAAVRPGLAMKKPRGYGEGTLIELRLTDRAAGGSKSVWQLYGTGSVGGQTLLGIAHLERLRRHPWLDGRLRVWPFETGLAPLLRPGPGEWRVLAVEIYPSMADAVGGDLLDARAGQAPEVKDARQVRCLGRYFAELDDDGQLAVRFAGPPGLDAEARRRVETEEGWILGIVAEPPRPATPAPAPAGALSYLRDPDEIYRQSFAAIRKEADLTGIDPALVTLAIRIIHAAGDPSLARDLVGDAQAVASGRAALAAGAPILVDSRMVAAGIIRRQLPAATEIVCTLNDEGVAEAAAAAATTRSAAAVERWLPRLAGAVAVIGNAPTSLFRLLELLSEGAPRPAVILGFPVGFVGAAESKDALIALAPTLGVPFVTLRGRRGGSAIAAAALNALGAPPP